MADVQTEDLHLVLGDILDATRALQDAINVATHLGMEVRVEVATLRQFGLLDRPLLHVEISQPK